MPSGRHNVISHGFPDYLPSMRERVAELGGELAVEPGHPRGTRVIACLPMGEQAV